ncbi:DUF4097 family beta strand repeat-containing protein [Clostridium sp. Marseille-P2415]|uniref:DUF4097 family beta strand repeat-containing protein n=1 Tax=Clostridium sp. Marseille-P2415 TaxID=1805471 RepID=UPI0009885173|nr:DUF4097 family beta strand repeat-containing protein [Clostridium sp. Marseille-P2415]
MKKFIKICLIAGGICVLIGGGIAFTAAALGGDLLDVVPQRAVQWRKEIPGITLDGFWEDLDDYYGREYTDIAEEGQEIYSSSEVKKLDVAARAGSVVFVEDPAGDRIRVFCNRDETHWSRFEENEKLELQVYPGRKGSGDDSGLLFTIHVPKDYHFSSVSLKLAHSNGSSDQEEPAPVLMAQSLSADEMNLETKAGTIKISQGNAGDLNIVSDVGAVDFSGTTSGNIDAVCRVGAIRMELAGKKEDYNYDIQCRLGAVKIGEESSAALKSKDTMDNGAGKNMDLECETGAIQVDFMNEL